MIGASIGTARGSQLARPVERVQCHKSGVPGLGEDAAAARDGAHQRGTTCMPGWGHAHGARPDGCFFSGADLSPPS